MTVYVFGNQDAEFDNAAFKIAEKLKVDFPALEFNLLKPNEDVNFDDSDSVVILDTVHGLKNVQVFDETAIDNITTSMQSTVHDFDLGFQLKYLKKLGKLNKIILVGLPMESPTNYSSIHSIFKKLVEQDMHGS